MRIVFMGTPEFAIPSLKILLDNHYPVVSVATAPDKPRGRGKQLSPPPIKVFAQHNNLPVLQPERLSDNGFIRQLKSLQPELFVVVAFRILPREVFAIPARGAFNLHASLLPKYRGAAPIHWAIINGEKETGVTTFFLEEKVDTGNIILQARVPIGPDETYGELHDRLAEVGAEIVLHTVRLVELAKAEPRPQKNTEATIAPKITKEHCRIDWTGKAEEVHNRIRGLSPSPCACTMQADRMIKVYRTRIIDTEARNKPGTICETNHRLTVAAGTGTLEILELQQEGKRKMRADEFLRGYRLSKGDTFL